MTRWMIFAPLLALLLLTAGCKDSPTEAGRSVGSIDITPSNPSVADGEIVQLGATVRDQHGVVFNPLPAGITVAWSSLDPSTASVDGSGRVTGERPGAAGIRATAGQAQSQVSVTVTQKPTTLVMVGGADQAGPAGQPLAESLVVRAVDRHGDGVPGAVVEFVVVGGGGSAEPASVTTGASGAAQAVWTLGPEAGENLAEARSTGLSGSPVAFTALATAPPCDVPAGYDKYWTGAVGTDWSDNGNWDPVGAPVATDNVFICAETNQPVLSANVTVNDLALEAGATLATNGRTLTATGDVDAGSTIEGTGTLVMAGTGTTLRGTVPHLTITGTVTLAGGGEATPGTTTVTGALLINEAAASLALGGHQLTVAGNFTRNNGRLIMTDPADLLVVGGDARFNSGDTEDDLTSGLIRVRGLFETVGTGTAFVSTGTAVIADGTAAQNITTHGASLSGTRFHDLTLTNPAGVTFVTATVVTGDLDLVGQLTVPNGVTASGIQMLFLRATSVLNNSGTIQTASCTTEEGHIINGTDPC